MNHTVQSGECLSSIAKLYGLHDWRTIYNHGKNQGFRAKRPNPNILLPGDELFIPDRAERTEKCPTGRTHRFVVKAPHMRLRIVLKDDDGEPFRGKTFAVAVEGREIRGTTGQDGLVDVEVPVTERTATLSAWLYDDDDPEDPDIEYDLLLGHLDPVDSTSGIQARLQNLGFACEVDGVLGEETTAAVRRFRAKYGLATEVDDPIGEAFRAKLVDIHEGA
jgi:hypothetical protein